MIDDEKSIFQMPYWERAAELADVPLWSPDDHDAICRLAAAEFLRQWLEDRDIRIGCLRNAETKETAYTAMMWTPEALLYLMYRRDDGYMGWTRIGSQMTVWSRYDVALIMSVIAHDAPHQDQPSIVLPSDIREGLSDDYIHPADR